MRAYIDSFRCVKRTFGMYGRTTDNCSDGEKRVGETTRVGGDSKVRLQQVAKPYQLTLR